MTSAARPRFPIILTILAVLLLGVLLALGVWQVQRMQWKEGLIASAEAAAGQPPLPLDEVLKLDNPEFRRVILTCRGLSAALTGGRLEISAETKPRSTSRFGPPSTAQTETRRTPASLFSMDCSST